MSSEPLHSFGLKRNFLAKFSSKWKEVPEQIKCEIEGSDKDM